MKLRKALALGLIGLVSISLLAPWAAQGGSQNIQSFLMFAGDCDSTTQVTAWIPVRNAQRVRIRTWSTHAAWTASNVDTAKVDTITAFSVIFSDSICCYVTGPNGNVIASAQDSVIVTSLTVAQRTAVDTSITMLGVYGAPVTRELRGAATGSGALTYIYPVQPNGSTAANLALNAEPDGTIGKSLMRVRFTPLRRNTPAGSVSTQGLRANGMRGIKMVADVQYSNK